MSKIGYGYGSEWHLLRYFGYHRHLLNDSVMDATGADDVEWLDSPFDSKAIFLDSEWKGLDFLPEGSPATEAWRDFWPRSGNVPNWDAVGRITIKGVQEWLLVEAKANVEELLSSCNAKSQGGLPMIQAALNKTKQAMGIDIATDWLAPYYQYANRLASLYVLNSNDVGARLLFVYFLGDSVPHKTCPPTIEEWRPGLEAMYCILGLTGNSPLEQRVHRMFLPVCLEKRLIPAATTSASE